MFKKLNTKSLAIAFVVLLAIVVLMKINDSKKGDKTIITKIADFEIADVSSIEVITKAETETAVKMIKEGNDWKIEQSGKSYNADNEKIENLLSEQLRIKPERLAATQKEKWEAYEVTDSLSVRVIIKKGNKVLSDIHIGKFSYQNPTNPYDKQGKMTTYIKRDEDTKIYAVQGFLRMTFNSGINSFRNEKITLENKLDWTKLTYTYPGDSSFILSKQNDKWMINGLLADSAKVSHYLGDISDLKSSDFIEDSLIVLTKESHKIRIEGNNMAPLEIKSIPGDEENGYYITSSINKGSYFSGNEEDIFETLFVGEKKLFGN